MIKKVRQINPLDVGIAHAISIWQRTRFSLVSTQNAVGQSETNNNKESRSYITITTVPARTESLTKKAKPEKFGDAKPRVLRDSRAAEEGEPRTEMLGARYR